MSFSLRGNEAAPAEAGMSYFAMLKGLWLLIFFLCGGMVFRI